jgi:hypothetical protein
MDEHPTDHPLVDDDAALVDDEESPRGRRRWPIVLVSIVVVIVAITTALYIAASHYEPLSQTLGGGYGSQVLSSNGSLAANRLAGGDRTIWTEPTGTFRVEVIVTITDDQRFGVTIDKVLAPPNPAGNSNVRVFFDSKGRGAGTYGYKGGPAFRPTALASKGSIQLVVHWNQQCVPASAASTTTYTTLPVEYSFVGFRHTVNVPIDDVSIRPRATC